MGRERFIADLVELLVKIDRGMLEFDEPLPQAVATNIIAAIVAFGEEALPVLHKHLEEILSGNDVPYIIDVLGSIGSSSSIPYLIEYHKSHASFISGLACVQAIKRIGTAEGYRYLASVITQYAGGKHTVINSRIEITVACQALGDWGDADSILPLKRVAEFPSDPNGMRDSAIYALARYTSAHPFLNELAKNDIEVKTIVDDALSPGE